jgi:transposase
MHKDRRTYSAEFKGKVALEAIKHERTLAELASAYNVSPEQINAWKLQLTTNVSLIFDEDNEGIELNPTEISNVSHAKIGDIIAENDFLTKVLGR